MAESLLDRLQPFQETSYSLLQQVPSPLNQRLLELIRSLEDLSLESYYCLRRVKEKYKALKSSMKSSESTIETLQEKLDVSERSKQKIQAKHRGHLIEIDKELDEIIHSQKPVLNRPQVFESIFLLSKDGIKEKEKESKEWDINFSESEPSSLDFSGTKAPMLRKLQGLRKKLCKYRKDESTSISDATKLPSDLKSVSRYIRREEKSQSLHIVKQDDSHIVLTPGIIFAVRNVSKLMASDKLSISAKENIAFEYINHPKCLDKHFNPEELLKDISPIRKNNKETHFFNISKEDFRLFPNSKDDPSGNHGSQHNLSGFGNLKGNLSGFEHFKGNLSGFENFKEELSRIDNFREDMSCFDNSKDELSMFQNSREDLSSIHNSKKDFSSINEFKMDFSSIHNSSFLKNSGEDLSSFQNFKGDLSSIHQSKGDLSSLKNSRGELNSFKNSKEDLSSLQKYKEDSSSIQKSKEEFSKGINNPVPADSIFNHNFKGEISSIHNSKGEISSIHNSKGEISSIHNSKGEISSIHNSKGEISSIHNSKGEISSILNSKISSFHNSKVELSLSNISNKNAESLNDSLVDLFKKSPPKSVRKTSRDLENANEKSASGHSIISRIIPRPPTLPVKEGFRGPRIQKLEHRSSSIRSPPRFRIYKQQLKFRTDQVPS